MHLFGEIGERNDLIKVLNRYQHKKAAQYVAGLSDREYKVLVPTLNGVIEQGGTDKAIDSEISKLADKYGLLEVAAAVMSLADKYAASLKGAKMGMKEEDSNTVVAAKLREVMKLEKVAKYLEGLWQQSRN